jgi:hypothetical protein
VIGIFCSGEEEIYANSGVKTFVKVCEEYGKVKLRDVGTPLSGEAEVLRRGLFDPERSAQEKMPTENIHIFEAEDKTAEAEFVAVQIKKAMLKDETARYRDFAVLVPSVSAYTLPLKRAFAEFRIPYFVDEKKSLKKHLGLNTSFAPLFYRPLLLDSISGFTMNPQCKIHKRL